MLLPLNSYGKFLSDVCTPRIQHTITHPLGFTLPLALPLDGRGHEPNRLHSRRVNFVSGKPNAYQTQADINRATCLFACLYVCTYMCDTHGMEDHATTWDQNIVLVLSCRVTYCCTAVSALLLTKVGAYLALHERNRKRERGVPLTYSTFHVMLYAFHA